MSKKLLKFISDKKNKKLVEEYRTFIVRAVVRNRDKWMADEVVK
jgi:hypothetical protein